jgi:hypothetical protein
MRCRGQAATRESPGRPDPSHHRGDAPSRTAAPPRRTVRLRLPSPFASVCIRRPPAFPPGGGRQTFARRRHRPVTRSVTAAAPPRWSCHDPLASAPFQGVPLPDVPTLLHVLPNTRVGPARMGRYRCSASAATVTTRCVPGPCRSRDNDRSRLPASACPVPRLAVPKHRIRVPWPTCRLRGLVST